MTRFRPPKRERQRRDAQLAVERHDEQIDQLVQMWQAHANTAAPEKDVAGPDPPDQEAAPA